MSALVSTMRPMTVPPTGAPEPRHQSAVGSMAGNICGLGVNRPWALVANAKAGTTAIDPSWLLRRRST